MDKFLIIEKLKQVHHHLLQAKVLMSEIGYDQAGNVTNGPAASSARLLTRVYAEYKYKFRVEINYQPRKRKRK